MDKAEKFWDKRAKGYENQEKRSENKAIEKSKPYLDRNFVLLDYGCGPGLMTNQFSDFVKEIQVIDISSKMIEIASKKAKEDKI